jgi:hypothetical protein
MDTAVRPHQSEFNEYYARYIDQVPEGPIVDVLRAQAKESLGLLERVDEKQAEYRYAPDKWSLKEVVGHVYDMEWVFTARALSFARGLALPMPGVEQDDFMAVANFGHQTLPALLAQWRELRAANTSLFASFDAEAWKRTGIASNNPVSVRALAYIIAGHERHHMRILRERYLG